MDFPTEDNFAFFLSSCEHLASLAELEAGQRTSGELNPSIERNEEFEELFRAFLLNLVSEESKKLNFFDEEMCITLQEQPVEYLKWFFKFLKEMKIRHLKGPERDHALLDGGAPSPLVAQSPDGSGSD